MVKWQEGPPIRKHRFKPQPLVMKTTTCNVCGNANHAEERVAKCRMCGTELKANRFTYEGNGDPDPNKWIRYNGTEN